MVRKLVMSNSTIRGLSAIHLPNYGNVQNTYTWFGWKEFHWKVQTPGVTSLGNVQHGVQQPAIWDDDQPTQPAARSRRLQWRWGLPHRWRWLHSRSRQWYWRLAEVRSLKEKMKWFNSFTLYTLLLLRIICCWLSYRPGIFLSKLPPKELTLCILLLFT